MGQVVSTTTVDEEGAPINGDSGYAKVAWEYDQNGLIIREFRTDVEGIGVANSNGSAGFERNYDDNARILMERYIDPDGAPIANNVGYAEFRRDYRGTDLIAESYSDPDGQPVNRTDGYSKAVWEVGETCTDLHFYDTDGEEVEIGTLNLARDVKVNANGWSDWLIPSFNAVNSCQNVGYANLGPKTEGDIYTSTIEIEFKDVTATEGQTFRFWTQGAQDGKWFTGNVWNGNLINLDGVPEDGIYQYTSTITVSVDMIDISTFDIGFRCDYWSSGMYRVRLVKVEKGDASTEWSPGL